VGSDSRDYFEHARSPALKDRAGYNCVDNQEIASLVAHFRFMSRKVSESAGYSFWIARLMGEEERSGRPACLPLILLQLRLDDPIPLVICGDGLKGRHRDLVQRLGLENSVSLAARRPDRGCAKQLAGCKALVLASAADETWGLVVNEAMAAGCQSWSHRQCGCARDLVEQGSNGFTV